MFAHQLSGARLFAATNSPTKTPTNARPTASFISARVDVVSVVHPNAL